MSIKIDKNINNNSIRYSSGVVTEDSVIKNICSKINTPTKHKCEQTLRYMYAFFMDLIRSITNFVFFIQPVLNVETELKIWSFLTLQIPTVTEENLKNLAKIRIIPDTDIIPNLLV